MHTSRTWSHWTSTSTLLNCWTTITSSPSKKGARPASRMRRFYVASASLAAGRSRLALRGSSTDRFEARRSEATSAQGRQVRNTKTADRLAEFLTDQDVAHEELPPDRDLIGWTFESCRPDALDRGGHQVARVLGEEADWRGRNPP